MRIRRWFGAVGAVVATFLSFAASAQEQAQVYMTADADLVLELAKGFGSASLEKDSSGDPMINGRIQGMKYVIWFYGCKEAKDCRSIQLSSGYTDEYSAEKANEWNAKYRWIKAYEKDGSNFKMDVDFKGGITRANLEAQLATWDSFIGDMKESVE
ncbi:MAG: YbjN domain-containing protein [Mesorhizobium sp.]|nr:YbjN domain-containing protein [Mesorhizobium sp.]